MGKAKSLRNRVSSYFQPPVNLGPKTAKLVSLIQSIEFIEVYSEIEALLLESKLIKKFKPPYNIASKDDKSPYYIHLTKEKYPKPIVNHESDGAIAGPFLSGWVARRILNHFRRISPYCTAKRNAKRPCLYSHIGLCDPCIGDPNIDSAKYQKNIARLKRLLKGDFVRVLSGLKKQMIEESKNQNYEAAATLRDKIGHLEQLLQNPIPPEEYLINPNLVSDKRQETLEALKSALDLPQIPERIEMYDVANLAGKDATGAMTVAEGGQTDTKLYRHFTIRSKDTPDDVAMMKEMLERRLKRDDWPQPDLIVLDGGRSQLSIINSQFPINVPVISLAKQEEIIFLPNGRQIKLDRRNPGLQLLQQLRDEAHRFSRRLHHKHRAKNLTQ